MEQQISIGKKPKLIILSDAPFISTGYSTISRTILNDLTNKYGWDCLHMSHNYFGHTIKKVELEDGTKFNFRIMGNSPGVPYCKDLLIPTIMKEKPDAFGILLDTFMLYPWIITEINFPCKTFFYFPTDGGQVVSEEMINYYKTFMTEQQVKDYLEFIETGIMPLGCENILKKMNGAVSMSRYGARQVKLKHGIDCAYIPHAVDTNMYYPMQLEQKKLLKDNFECYLFNNMKVKGILKDKFVVGSVFRNQGRKMADRTFKVFRYFAVEKPDAVLLLHCDPYDVAQVFNMVALIQEYKLQNKVFFTGMKWYDGFSLDQMREIYNLMDIFILTTSGEGFGIPIIEAMACKVPPLVTDYTTSAELIIEDGQCGEVILTNDTLTGAWNVPRAVCSIQDAVIKLNKFYDDWKTGGVLIKKYGEVGLAKVNKFYNWEKVSKDWDNWLREFIKK